MIQVKTIRIVFIAVIWVAAVYPATAQVTRIDTIKYPDTALPDRKTQIFNTDYLYTIGLKVYGYEQFPSILNQTDDDTYFHTYVNGLMLGFNSNQMTYRLQAALFRDDNVGRSACRDCEGAFDKFNHTAFKLGFQYNINYLRLQPYIGADLGVMLQRYQTGYAPSGDVVTIVERKITPLASPFVGVRAFIIPRLSVAAEANFNVGRSIQKTSGGIAGGSTRHAWETFFAPLAGITLQYHFGSLTY